VPFFDPALIAPYFIWRDGVATASVAGNLILPANANRVFVLFNLNIASQKLRPGQVPGAAGGIVAQTANFLQTFSFADVGALVGQEWYANSPAGPGAVYWLEVVYYPEGVQ
jgi:hypothetical protein